MAFPSVAAADTKSGTQTTNATGWTLTYPTNIAADDLLLAFIAHDGNTGNVGTFPSGWVADFRSDGSLAAALVWAKKKAAGTETGNFTWTCAATEQGAWRVIRIPASQWEGTLGTNFGNVGASIGSAVSTKTGGSSTTPDPPSCDPANWDAEDMLWIALSGHDGTPTYTGFPTGFTQEDHSTAGGHGVTSGGSGGAGLGIAYRKENTTAKDPGTFTLSGSESWATATIGVRPAGAVAPTGTFASSTNPVT